MIVRPISDHGPCGTTCWAARATTEVMAVIVLLALAAGCKEMSRQSSQASRAATKAEFTLPALPEEAAREFVSALARRDYTTARRYLATGEVYCKPQPDNQLVGCLKIFDLLSSQIKAFAERDVPKGLKPVRVVTSSHSAINAPGASYLKDAPVYKVIGTLASGEIGVVVQVVETSNGYGIAIPVYRKKAPARPQRPRP